MDMSKKNSSYRTVGTQSVYWDKSDTSLVITGRALYNVEFSVATSSSYRDGTRFWWASDTFQQDLTAFGSQTQVNDISLVGSFSIVTKDLQEFKQS